MFTLPTVCALIRVPQRSHDVITPNKNRLAWQWLHLFFPIFFLFMAHSLKNFDKTAVYHSFLIIKIVFIGKGLESTEIWQNIYIYIYAQHISFLLTFSECLLRVWSFPLILSRICEDNSYYLWQILSIDWIRSSVHTSLYFSILFSAWRGWPAWTVSAGSCALRRRRLIRFGQCWSLAGNQRKKKEWGQSGYSLGSTSLRSSWAGSIASHFCKFSFSSSL